MQILPINPEQAKPIYDSFDLEYKSIFGAVRQNEELTFKLRFPSSQAAEITEPTLIMYRPGFKERFIQLDFHDTEDGYSVYCCNFAPHNSGLHFYYFSVSRNGNREYINRNGLNIGAFGGNDLFQMTVYSDNFTTPDWLKGGIIYQIFPDRFAKAHNSAFDYSKFTDRQLHSDWNEKPEWKPNDKGKITNSDYFCGNLKGIEEKIPYLVSIGVTCVYLCPIFEAHENHRYNTANYEKIDPLLGTEDDFTELCRKADEAGIKIILDGVFSHTGADSVYFNKFGRYGEKTGAFRDPESPYRDWYSFSRYPDTYESWWGFDTLPNVNENDPHFTEYICGNGGILQKWLDKGAAGWRLDVADELPDEFIDNLRIAVKAKGEDKIIYGEVWEDASNKESYGVKRKYLIGSQLDSVMNYPFKDAILNYVKYSDPGAFVTGILTIIENYPKPAIDVLMNMISTHDTERALTWLGGEPAGANNREWQALRSLSDSEYIYGLALLKCAMVLQFFLPGIPCVYYGDEAGMEGYKCPFNRGTYPWGNEDEDLIDYVRKLGEIRKSCKSLAKGHLLFGTVTKNSCVFYRIDKEENEATAVYLNKSKKTLRIPLVLNSLPFAGVNSESYEFLHRADRKKSSDSISVSPYDYEVVRFTLTR